MVGAGSAIMATLQEVLQKTVREGELYEKLERGFVRCYACGHCCRIPDGQVGVCKVRYNEGGKLFVPWGYVASAQCDPIEKKPFYHAYPGALAYSFGMLGCDLHCGYCQNWVTSQALRDPSAVSSPLRVTPEELVQEAVQQGAKVVVSTYNEPLITSEWAVAVFKEVRAAGLTTGYVSNGNGTPQVLEYLRRAVAIGNIPRGEPRRAGFLEDCHRPFAGDERLIVSAHHDFRALPHCLLDQLFRCHAQERLNCAWVAQGL